MDPVASLKELERLLPAGLLSEQLRIGHAVTGWLARHRGQCPPAALVERWLEQARASVAVCAQRRRHPLRLAYPEALPITARREEIVAAIRAHPVLVIAGETGSGKSTQIPKFLLEAGAGVRARIGCTQPRRIAALSLSRRLAEELDVSWGHEVGCKIRFSDDTRPETRVKFMTDGLLLAEAQADPWLSDYEAIVIDEAHERSLNIDFLLGLLRTRLGERPDLKLVITSATINTEAFSRHFNSAPIIEVSGRLYPVEILHAPPQVPADAETFDPDDPETPDPPTATAAAAAADVDYVEAAVEAIGQLVAADERGDILVFFPGERDILEARAALGRAWGESLELVPLFGRLSAAEQQRVFAPSPRRKVVLATNVAETSLTVPGIRFVVDTGLARISRYHARTRTKRLPIEPIAQSSARQRAGRCGRVEAGLCIRLYAENDFASRPAHTPPEIQRANLAEVILRMKAFALGEIETFPFLDPPTSAAIQGGYQLLQELGALDADRALTDIGHTLARLPVDPTIGRMILEAQREGALREVLVIAAGLSIQDPRERPLDRRDTAAAAHRRFQHPESDFLTLLNIWDAYHDTFEALPTQNQMRKFCRAHFLSYLRLREWRDIHAQLRDVLADLGGFEERSTAAPPAAIHRSILTGLWGHVALRKDRNLYQLAGNRQALLFPGSGLFERTEPRKPRPGIPPTSPASAPPPPRSQQPAWVMAGELVETSRLFLRTAAGIDPLWIVELGDHLCRRTHHDPRWDARAGRVVCRERITLHGLVVLERTIPFAAVNPTEATELFLRAALVEEGLADHFQPRRPPVHGRVRPTDDLRETPAPETESGEAERDLSRLPPLFRFLAHNRQVRQKLEVWQTRRHQRVVGDLDSVLYDYYARHLTDLASIPDLQRLLREHAGQRPGFLEATEADLLGEHATEFDRSAFPDALTVGDQQVPVGYHYAPGEAHDGVTLRLPFSLAQVVDPAVLDWAVPALREPRILHLLQNLPKPLRRALMPLGPKAHELALASLNVAHGHELLRVLSTQVRRLYQIEVPLAAWPTGSLPDHLRPRFEIVGDNHQTLATGRDLPTLRQQVEAHDTTTETAAWQRAVEAWERYDLRQWPDRDLPGPFVVADVGGFPLRAFPALQLEASQVALRLFRTADEAAAAHAPAVARLLELTLARELAWLQKDLRSLRRWAPLCVTLGPIEQLEASAYAHLCRQLLQENTGAIRSAAAFDARIREVREQLPNLVTRLSDQVGPILELRHALLLVRQPYPGLRAELDALLPADFLRHIAPARLVHLPRYLKAIRIRAERAAVQPTKDQEKWQRVQPYALRLVQLHRQIASTGGSPACLAAFEACRWLLEEYKVSVFAQELGTAEPVSPARLEQALVRVTARQA